LKCCLTGAAGQLLWESGTPSQLTFDELSTKLRRRYGSVDKEELYQLELRTRRRRKNESLAELHQEIKRLMTLAYPVEACSKLGENIAKDAFLAALDDKELAIKISEREVSDLDSAYRHAVRIEATRKAFDDEAARETGKGRNTRTVHDDLQNRHVESVDDGPAANRFGRRRPWNGWGGKPQYNNEATADELRRNIDELRQERDQLSKEVDRQRLMCEQIPANTSWQQLQQQQAQQPLVQRGVIPLQQQPLQQQNMQPGFTQGPLRAYDGPPRPVVKCFKCGGLGHFQRQCRSRERDEVQAESAAMTTAITTQSPVVTGAATTAVKQPVTIARTTVEPARDDYPVYLQMSIKGVDQYCCLDTGSEVTLIPYGLVLEIPIQKEDRLFVAANGTSINVLGRSCIDGVIDGRCFKIEGLISD